MSTLSVRGGLWVAPVHRLHMPKPVITFMFDCYCPRYCRVDILKIFVDALFLYVAFAARASRGEPCIGLASWDHGNSARPHQARHSRKSVHTGVVCAWCTLSFIVFQYF